jgi:hypothetical protein
VVFTLDAMLAVATLGLFLSAIIFMSTQSTVESLPAIMMKKKSNDVLSALDASGVLASMNMTTINGSLYNVMTPSFAYRARIEYYTYFGGGFNSSSVLDFGQIPSTSRESIMSQREFVVYNNSRVQNYGIAKLWVTQT